MSAGAVILGTILALLIIGNVLVTIANRRLIKRRHRGNDHGGGPERTV